MVIGALAAFVLFSYVSGLEDKVNDDAELVEAVQAKGSIQRGTDTATAQAQGLIGLAKIQKQFLPANAVTTVEEIEGRVAVFDISENTVILDSMFVDAGQAVSQFRDRIRNPEYATVTISIDDVGAVGGNLTPGDEVNILVYCENRCTTDGTAPIIPELEVEGWLGYRYLYQKAHILAMGQLAALDLGEQVVAEEGAAPQPAQENATRGLITFDMPVDGVQLLATLETATEFSLYLSLVPQDYEPAPIPFLEIDRLGELPGEVGAELTPYGPAGRQEQ